MLTQYEEYLNAMQKAYDTAVGARDLLQGQLAEKEVELAKVREDIATWEQVQALFAKVSEFAREQLKTRIEETVTAALWQCSVKVLLRINMRASNGQPAADWQVVSQYGDLEVTSPEDA